MLPLPRVVAMLLCPAHIALPSPAQGLVNADRLSLFLAMIVWDGQAFISNLQECPRCRPAELSSGPGMNLLGCHRSCLRTWEELG